MLFYKKCSQNAVKSAVIYLKAEKTLEGKDRDALQMEQSELYTQLSNVNAELRKLRSELHLCNVISRDELEIERKLELELYRENTHKEKSNSLPYLRG